MPDPAIDEIKRRLDIAEFVGRRVSLKKQGRGLKGLCPFHQEKTPSFVVYPDQGTYHCFGCGKGGDVFTWVQETEHLDFGDTLRLLADKAGVTLPERRAITPDPDALASASALDEAARWFHLQLLTSPEADPARQYLARRGVKRETVERFGIGWAPDRWDALCSVLRSLGLTTQHVVDAGLGIQGERGLHDRFRGRVMFPIRTPDGKTTGFGGRILGAAREGAPKYLNSPQTTTFDKSATLYALDLARQSIRKDGYAVIVEGYMDVVLPHQEGFTNVVASLGTALTARQIELLRRYTDTMILALDADAAGQAATLRGLEVARLALYGQRRPVRAGPLSKTGFLASSSGQIKIAVLKGGKDPDEIVREDPAAWRQLIDGAVSMMDHKLAVELARVRMDDPQSKSQAIQELARFLVLVPDQIEWEHYADRIAQRLRVEMQTVRTALRQAETLARRELRQNARDRREALQEPAPGARETRDTRQAGTPDRPLPDASHSAPSGASSGASSGTSPGDSPAAPATVGHYGDSGAASKASRVEFTHAGGPDRSVGPARPPVSNETIRTDGPAMPAAGDAAEEHLVSLLVLSPPLIRLLPAWITPDALHRPECRELLRIALQGLEQGPARSEAASAWPGVANAPTPGHAAGGALGTIAGTTPGSRVEFGGPETNAQLEDAHDPFQPIADQTLRAYYERVRRLARRRPPQTDSQLEADLAGVVQRIRERNLRGQIMEAQYLLAEADSEVERLQLERQVERLAAQLGRVHLERSRAALYTSPPG